VDGIEHLKVMSVSLELTVKNRAHALKMHVLLMKTFQPTMVGSEFTLGDSDGSECTSNN
jgi:hypothetical protein